MIHQSTYDEITVHQYIEEVSTCSEGGPFLSFASDKKLRNVLFTTCTGGASQNARGISKCLLMCHDKHATIRWTIQSHFYLILREQ